MILEMCHFSRFHLWCPVIYEESQLEGGVKFHNGSDLGQEMNYWDFFKDRFKSLIVNFLL